MDAMTVSYANGTEEGLRTWNDLIGQWEDGMSAEDFRDALDHGAVELGDAEDLWENLSDGTFDSPYDCWEHDLLEMKGRADVSISGDVTIKGITVLLTFGGPNTWLDHEEGNAWLTLRTYWGGDVDVRTIYLPAISSRLDGMFDCFPQR